MKREVKIRDTKRYHLIFRASGSIFAIISSAAKLVCHCLVSGDARVCVSVFFVLSMRCDCFVMINPL